MQAAASMLLTITLVLLAMTPGAGSPAMTSFEGLLFSEPPPVALGTAESIGSPQEQADPVSEAAFAPAESQAQQPASPVRFKPPDRPVIGDQLPAAATLRPAAGREPSLEASLSPGAAPHPTLHVLLCVFLC